MDTPTFNPVFVWHPEYASNHPRMADTPEELARCLAHGWFTTKDAMLRKKALGDSAIPEDLQERETEYGSATRAHEETNVVDVAADASDPLDAMLAEEHDAAVSEEKNSAHEMPKKKNIPKKK